MSMTDALTTVAEQKRKAVEDASNKRFSHMPGAIKTFAAMWPNQPSKVDTLRASGMYFLCPREFVLNYWQPQANKSFDLKSHLMMNMGTSMHTFLQNCVLGPMGVMSGLWTHWSKNGALNWVRTPDGTGGDVYSTGYHPDPERSLDEMVKQQPLTWRYEEYSAFDQLHRIAGHCDGVLSIDRIKWLSDNLKLFRGDPKKAHKELQSIAPGDECLGEIKTSGAFVFKKIGQASDIPDYYKMQAVIYQELMEFPQTVFWYISRDTCESKVVVYEKEKSWWNDAKNKARVTWEAIRDRKIPDTFQKCVLPTDKRAKSCVFCKACWDKKLDVAKYISDGETRAAKESRKLLDLSGVTF